MATLPEAKSHSLRLEQLIKFPMIQAGGLQSLPSKALQNRTEIGILFGLYPGD
jgi:hypothetical protein